MNINKINEKYYWYISLIISYIVFILLIYFRYKKFDINFPLCWDPPGYAAVANLILKNGPMYWMLKNNSFSLLYMIIALIGMILSNTSLSTIIIQTFGALILIFLYSYLTLKITDSYYLAAITSPITLFSTNFVRLYGAPNQMYALLLSLIIITKIDYISDNFKIRNLYSIILVGVFSTAFWIHSMFTYIPFMLIISIYAIIRLNHRKNVTQFIILSTIFGMIPQLPFIFNQILFSTIQSSSRTDIINPNISLYYSYLEKWAGGNAILLIISTIGFLSLINRYKEKDGNFSLIAIIWITILLLLYQFTFLFSSFWPFWNVYASRIVLILPIPILLTVGLFILYSFFENFFRIINGETIEISINFPKKYKVIIGNVYDKRRRVFLKNARILKLLSIVISLSFSIVTILPSFNVTQNIVWQPFINPSVHDKILFIETELRNMGIQQIPIFVFYEMPYISPGGIDYRRSIIGIEMGVHYIYYGKLSYLLTKLETPSSMLTWNLDKTQIYSNLFWNELIENDIINNLEKHPIIIISPYFYKDMNTLEFIQNYSHGNGIYIIPPNSDVEIPHQTIVCYKDYSSATKGFYASSCNWSVASNVLNHYIPSVNYSKQSEVNFPLFIENGSYIVKIHYYDANSIYFPVYFYINNSLMYTLFYNGTNKPAWKQFSIKYNYDYPETLRVIIKEGSPHYFKFDVIYIYRKNDY